MMSVTGAGISLEQVREDQRAAVRDRVEEEQLAADDRARLVPEGRVGDDAARADQGGAADGERPAGGGVGDPATGTGGKAARFESAGAVECDPDPPQVGWHVAWRDPDRSLDPHADRSELVAR